MKGPRWIVVISFGGLMIIAIFTSVRFSVLRNENVTLLRENEQLQEAARLARRTAPAGTNDTGVNQGRIEEINRLRNEVAQLRAAARESDKARAENDRLRARPAVGDAANSVPPAAPDRFPRENWAFAGYATPEAALVSAIAAMKDGNPKGYLESLTPDEQVRMAKSWENKTESELVAKHQQDVSNISSVRVLEKQEVSADEVVMKVLIEGVDRLERVSLKRVGNDWKFGGFIREPKK